jgi:hypothetical protein
MMKNKLWRSECADRIAAGIISYCRRVDSLDKAVAEKRRREAEASRRWTTYLAAQKSQPVQQPVLVAEDVNPAKEPAALKIPVKAVKAQPAEKPVAAVDLDKLATESIQSVATNIYLSKEEGTQITGQKDENDLRSLIEFYEKGTLN